MTWEANLANDAEIQKYFVRASCRVVVPYGDFTLHAGSVYKAPFTHGPVTGVRWGYNDAPDQADNPNTITDFTEGVSATLNASEFFYDRAEQMLYVRLTDSSAPVTGELIVAEFYLFFSNEEVYWHETPDDDTTDLVLWRPIIQQAPAYRLNIPPQGLGFFPISPTSLVLINDKSLNYLLYYGSFYRALCETWHQAGKRTVANINKIVTGVFGQGVNIDDQEIRFEVLDKSLAFDLVHPGQYWPSTGTIDPRFAGTPVLDVWGHFGNNLNNAPVFEMINLDYLDVTPTTGENRLWGLVYDPSNFYGKIEVSGHITSDRLILDNSSDYPKFKRGDKIWFGGGSGQYDLEVDFFDVGSNNIQLVSAANAGTETARRCFCGNVYVIQSEKIYRALFGRDYVETLHPGNFRGIEFHATAESTMGIATFDPSNGDRVFCTFEGRKTIPTNNAVALPVDAEFLGWPFARGVHVLYDYLKSSSGLAESEIDFTSFENTHDISYWQVLLSVPFGQLEDFPRVREVIDQILKSMLLKAFFNADGKFSIKPYKPIESETSAATIGQDEVMDYRSEMSYGDIAALTLKKIWDSRSKITLVASGTKQAILAGTGTSVQILDGPASYQRANSIGSLESETLHETDRTIEFENIVTVENPIPYGTGILGGQALAFTKRVRDFFGERLGTIRFGLKKIFFNRDLDEYLTVSRESLPGFNFTEGTEQTKIYDLIEIEKSQDGVDITLDDRKFANDHSSEDHWLDYDNI